MIILTRGVPRRIDPNHNYVVLYSNGVDPHELFIQTELTDTRADYSVEILNERRIQKALKPFYYWRRMSSDDKERLEFLSGEVE